MVRVKSPVKFVVRVGAVVRHRDENEGVWCHYLDVGAIGKKKNVKSLTLKRRRSTSQTVRAPFVAIRRTSRPEDTQRLQSVVISGKIDVVVENHLLIIKPTSGRLRDCYALVDYFSSPNVNRWVNRRIRCRHLSVETLKELAPVD